MTKNALIATLNQLVRMFSRSLPAYLIDAAPWSTSETADGVELLQSIANDQNQIVDEMAELIMDHGGIVDRGSFPTEFTDLHDLSVDYLVRETSKYQVSHVAATEAAVSALNGDRDARALGERVLGVAKAHLDALNDYLGQK